MKPVLILLLSLGAIGLAQNPQEPPEQKPQTVKRLGVVTWDGEHHKLGWEVQKGTMVNGQFVAESSERYEITPEDAVMAKADDKHEQRGFSPEEADSLQQLLDVLSVYCAESSVWWDHGQGAPMKPGAKATDKDGKPTKVDQSVPKKAPLKLSPGELIAAVNVANLR